ncbi:MAG: hypothetical protein K2X27_16530, partial [Candidatus Obscuribacterales bacterium]|nr:hypothetical protein [Candidatus Obscuribacterales bacterium]
MRNTGLLLRNRTTLLVSILFLCSCSPQESESQKPLPEVDSTTTVNLKALEIKKKIEDLAAAADSTVEDGWFYGRDPRLFKSLYRKISPEQKADFAMEYHSWIKTQAQNLIADFKTYIPYSKRASFARTWWSKKNKLFPKEEDKQQVLWVHEAIQDAGELWWRAVE